MSAHLSTAACSEELPNSTVDASRKLLAAEEPLPLPTLNKQLQPHVTPVTLVESRALTHPRWNNNQAGWRDSSLAVSLEAAWKANVLPKDGKGTGNAELNSTEQYKAFLQEVCDVWNKKGKSDYGEFEAEVVECPDMREK